MAQTILVTGSTSGFGRLMVETLARQGYIVFAGMRAVAGKNAPAAEELRVLAEREHLALHIVEIDITDDASVEQAIASLVGITGRLDVVVNNAGIAYSGPLEAFTLKQVQQQFDTNVFGVLRVNRAALPHMRRLGSGLLLQIGSIAGRLALPFQGLYAATKFALEGAYCPLSGCYGCVYDAVFRGEPIRHASRSPGGGRRGRQSHRPTSGGEATAHGCGDGCTTPGSPSDKRRRHTGDPILFRGARSTPGDPRTKGRETEAEEVSHRLLFEEP